MSQVSPPDGVQLGIYQLLRTGPPTPYEGETVGGVQDTGTALPFSLIAPNGVHLTIDDIRWSNGERDVRVIRRHGTPELYDSVVSRLRLAVNPEGMELAVDLRQARPGIPNARPTLRNATLDQLDAGAGVSVVDELRRLGGRVGTKSDLLHATGTDKNRFCCLFDPGAELLPAAVFVLTRVAPVGSGYAG